jgi:hypothetical protein
MDAMLIVDMQVGLKAPLADGQVFAGINHAEDG